MGDPDDGVLQPGDIIVCAALTPAWTPLIAKVAGIVSETGGALSSAATVARERSIPAVLAVNGATSRIRDGQIITMDGTSGIVSSAV